MEWLRPATMQAGRIIGTIGTLPHGAAVQPPQPSGPAQIAAPLAAVFRLPAPLTGSEIDGPPVSIGRQRGDQGVGPQPSGE
jgi:hypothetical protein